MGLFKYVGDVVSGRISKSNNVLGQTTVDIIERAKQLSDDPFVHEWTKASALASHRLWSLVICGLRKDTTSGKTRFADYRSVLPHLDRSLMMKLFQLAAIHHLVVACSTMDEIAKYSDGVVTWSRLDPIYEIFGLSDEQVAKVGKARSEYESNAFSYTLGVESQMRCCPGASVDRDMVNGMGMAHTLNFNSQLFMELLMSGKL